MANPKTFDLLSEALALLNDTPLLSLRYHRRRSSIELAKRIEVHLAELGAGATAILVARQRWAMSGFIRVDPDETEFEETSGGYWIRGWIRIGKGAEGESGNALRERYEAALASLPLFTREVFNSHRLKNLSYTAIADEFGISYREVETLIAEALLAVFRAFQPQD